MRGVLVCALVLALVGAGTALAARGDPKEELTPADNARARASLLRKSDLGPGFTASRSNEPSNDFYCRALDESDLTISGEAQSPDFRAGFVFVSSYADVYKSATDANASWQRGTSAAGQACLREGLRREFQTPKSRLVSFKRVPFPRLAERSVAFRAVAEQEGVRVYMDVIALKQSRAFGAIVVVSALAAPPKTVAVRLAGVMAGRMARAMGG